MTASTMSSSSWRADRGPMAGTAASGSGVDGTGASTPVVGTAATSVSPRTPSWGDTVGGGVEGGGVLATRGAAALAAVAGGLDGRAVGATVGRAVGAFVGAGVEDPAHG